VRGRGGAGSVRQRAEARCAGRPFQPPSQCSIPVASACRAVPPARSFHLNTHLVFTEGTGHQGLRLSFRRGGSSSRERGVASQEQ